MITIKNEHSPQQILSELGARLRQARLNHNMTQKTLATMIGAERKLIGQAEKGEASLATLVAILKALGMTSQLNNFIPSVEISPLQLAKMHGRKRQRASGSSEIDGSKGSNTW